MTRQLQQNFLILIKCSSQSQSRLLYCMALDGRAREAAIIIGTLQRCESTVQEKKPYYLESITSVSEYDMFTVGPGQDGNFSCISTHRILTTTLTIWTEYTYYVFTHEHPMLYLYTRSRALIGSTVHILIVNLILFNGLICKTTMWLSPWADSISIEGSMVVAI